MHVNYCQVFCQHPVMRPSRIPSEKRQKLYRYANLFSLPAQPVTLLTSCGELLGVTCFVIVVNLSR